jgi:hypothetical protein
LLFDLRAARMLSPFLFGEQTLSTASKALGVAPSTLAHWIPKFLRTRLIRETRREPRRGAAMRWYQAAGDELFIPMAHIPDTTRIAFLDAGRRRVLDRFAEGMDEQLSRDPATGLRFRSSGPTAVEVELEPPPAERGEPWTEFWGTINLTRAEAHAFAEDLASVIERYRRLEGGPIEVVVHAGAVRAATRSRRRRVAARR